MIESISATTGDEVRLYVGPSIPDDAPSRVKEGLSRRHIVAAGGACPCGARLRLPSRAARRRAARERRAIHVEVWHRDGCPASDPYADTRQDGAAR